MVGREKRKGAHERIFLKLGGGLRLSHPLMRGGESREST